MSSNQIVVVSGGSRGIGAAVVARLAGSGAKVVFGYRTEREAAERLVEELAKAGGEVYAVQADVTDPAASQALVHTAERRYGAVTAAVSNAGVEHFGSLESITIEDYRRVFDVNVAGQLFFTQAAAAAMGPGGRIVLMSSISGSIGVRDHALYGASKAAVMALARNLAPELGSRRITINAVAPGGTNTDMSLDYGPLYTPPQLRGLPPEDVVASMTGAGRWAEPDEIATVVEFLLSPGSSYLSGVTIPVTGGWIG